MWISFDCYYIKKHISFEILKFFSDLSFQSLCIYSTLSIYPVSSHTVYKTIQQKLKTQVVALLHHNSRVPDSILRSRYCLYGFSVYSVYFSSPCSLVSFQLQRHANWQIGHCKLPLGVNVQYVCKASCILLHSIQVVFPHHRRFTDSL